MTPFDEKYCIDTFKKLLAADSTTGQYEQVQAVVSGILGEMGIPCQETRKGGVIADMGGDTDNGRRLRRRLLAW